MGGCCSSDTRSPHNKQLFKNLEKVQNNKSRVLMDRHEAHMSIQMNVIGHGAMTQLAYQSQKLSQSASIHIAKLMLIIHVILNYLMNLHICIHNQMETVPKITLTIITII